MNQIKTDEERLRAEIEELKRKLREKETREAAPKGPTARTLLVVVLLLAALALAGYFFGYRPRQQREAGLAAEARASGESLPVVNVARVTRASGKATLVLPGNIQAVTEAPVLARASGYVKKRYVDMGDRVRSGQVLAEIEAPELLQQIQQAKATVDQANSTVEQARAALQQGQSNEQLAGVTKDRWQKLFDKGVVSRQENDTYQTQFAAQRANVQALQKAVAAAQSNGRAAEANLARLTDLLAYQTVRAPFAGVITVRNIDTGALVNEGSTMLFRIAQTDRLRTYVNAPQGDAAQIKVGQQATLTIADLAGRTFTGKVARTANALDPASRTLLVEIQVPNASGELLPGMYAQVDLAVPKKDPPLQIPGDTLVMRSDGPQVAVVRTDGTVHYTRIQLGRDFGDRLEVLSGLQEGQEMVINPGDAIVEGVKVKTTGGEKPAKKRS